MASLIVNEIVNGKYSREIDVCKTYNIIDSCEEITESNMELTYGIRIAHRNQDGKSLSDESITLSNEAFEELYQKMKQIRKAKVSLKKNMKFEVEMREKNKSE